MPQQLRHAFISTRELLISFGPFILLGIVLLALAYWALDPTPPKVVTLATGPAQSAYDEFGKRYAAELRSKGIYVRVLQTEGSSANLALLRAGKADLGFVQGGSGDAALSLENAQLNTLGSLFVEPIWLFYSEKTAKTRNAGKPITALPQLAQWRLNVGTAGSGVPELMNKLLQSNRMEPSALTLSTLDEVPATQALLEGDVDAIVFASAPESLLVQMLLQTPGIKLMNVAQNEAYSRRFAFLSPVALPRGVVDLAADNPPQDVRLVAPTTSLLARTDTHPALVQLFAEASQSIHGGAGWFNKAHDFPNAKQGELPLAKEAERLMKNGAPLLQRYLPFWLANLVDRMWVALGIIVAILLPLSRVLPPLYAFRIRSRVFRWYAQLRDVELEFEAQGASADKQPLLAELNRLEALAGKISVPLSYADELYALRNNIHLVRKKVLRE
jgi:NMT1-like family